MANLPRLDRSNVDCHDSSVHICHRTPLNEAECPNLSRSLRFTGKVKSREPYGYSLLFDRVKDHVLIKDLFDSVLALSAERKSHRDQFILFFSVQPSIGFKSGVFTFDSTASPIQPYELPKHQKIQSADLTQYSVHK